MTKCLIKTTLHLPSSSERDISTSKRKSTKRMEPVAHAKALQFALLTIHYFNEQNKEGKVCVACSKQGVGLKCIPNLVLKFKGRDHM
jgi:hypothetical protein